MLSNDVLKSLIYQVQQTLVSRPRLFSTSFWVYFSHGSIKAPGRHQRVLVTCMVEQMDMLGKWCPAQEPSANDRWAVEDKGPGPRLSDGQLWLSRHSRGPLMRGPGNHKTTSLGMHPLLAFLPPFSRSPLPPLCFLGSFFQVTVTVTVFLRVSFLGTQAGTAALCWTDAFGPTLQKQSSMDQWSLSSPSAQSPEKTMTSGATTSDILEEICAYRWIPQLERGEVMSVVRGTRLGSAGSPWVWSPEPGSAGLLPQGCDSHLPGAGAKHSGSRSRYAPSRRTKWEERTWPQARGRWSSFGFKLP